MWTKYLAIIILFFWAATIQISFFSPNLVFIFFFINLFFERKQQYAVGFFISLLAGVLLDIITSLHFGVSILLLLIIYILWKLFVQFFKEPKGQKLLFYFIASFCLAFAGYMAIVATFSLAAFLYSLAVAIIGFYIFKHLFYRGLGDNQLKLL